MSLKVRSLEMKMIIRNRFFGHCSPTTDSKFFIECFLGKLSASQTILAVTIVSEFYRLEFYHSRSYRILTFAIVMCEKNIVNFRAFEINFFLFASVPYGKQWLVELNHQLC